VVFPGLRIETGGTRMLVEGGCERAIDLRRRRR